MEQNSAHSSDAVARSAAGHVLGATPDSFVSPLTVLASPGWRGVEGEIWRASAGGRSVIVKQYHPDTAFYVGPGLAIEAARAAGDCGVGPEVLHGDVESRLLVMEDLSPPWRAGGLHDAYNRRVRENVIAAKKTFQQKAKLSHTASVFDEISQLYDLVVRSAIRTHNDVAVFKDFIDDAHRRINSLGIDQIPCHRDGNTSNLMVGEDLSVRLLDFDLAANCDPFEEIGCYLQEYFDNDADARTGFEEWHGHFDEGLFQRAMLYGLADDLRWALIASVMGATSPRASLEYTKYAAWRFLRLEAHVKRSDVSARIRVAA